MTGAGGRTGGLVMQRLLEQPEAFAARGLVRSAKSAAQLRGWGAAEDQVVLGDLLQEGGAAALAHVLEGAEALVIATSAVPKIKPLSLIPVLWAKVTGATGVRPQFTFKDNQFPEQIDWLGQKAQIDAAKAAGVKKVVIISRWASGCASACAAGPRPGPGLRQLAGPPRPPLPRTLLNPCSPARPLTRSPAPPPLPPPAPRCSMGGTDKANFLNTLGKLLQSKSS